MSRGTSGNEIMEMAGFDSGGFTLTRVKSAATTNATLIKNGPGVIVGWYLFNTSGALSYFKVYNKATAPTVGTDVPAFTIPLPAGGGAVVSFTKSVPLTTGISFAITTGIADADTAATAANDVHGFIITG